MDHKIQTKFLFFIVLFSFYSKIYMLGRKKKEIIETEAEIRDFVNVVVNFIPFVALYWYI